MPIVIGGDPKEARKGKRTVAIVGFAPTTRHLVPYDDSDVEIWGLNEAYHYGFMVDKDGHDRWDRWFQIHQRWNFTRLNNENHHEHWKWLKGEPTECRCHFYPRAREIAKSKGLKLEEKGINAPPAPEDCKRCDNGIYPPRDTSIPIYMMPDPFPDDPEDFPPAFSQCWDDVPGSQVFPYYEIVEKYLYNIHRQMGKGTDENPWKIILNEYFTSSFAYMCSLALYLGFERIEIYGFEMATETEYNYQKGSTEMWIGIASQHAEVYLPHEWTRLCLGRLYGVEVSQMINRQHLGFRFNQLTQMHNNAIADLNVTAGRKKEAMDTFEQIRQKYIKLNKALEGARTPGERKRAEKAVKEISVELEQRRKHAEELFNLELRQVNQVNAIVGAKAEIEAQLSHIDCQQKPPEENDPTTDIRGVPVAIVPNAALEVNNVTRSETKTIQEKETATPDGGG
jgi:hypothetical protein